MRVYAGGAREPRIMGAGPPAWQVGGSGPSVARPGVCRYKSRPAGGAAPLCFLPARIEPHTTGEKPMSMFIGEALVGDGNEIAHIDLLIGDKAGPVGTAFANALANQSHGHSNLLAVLTPNLLCKPATVLITKVTIKGMTQAGQMFGPAQKAVAKAVADCTAAGVIPQDKADDYVIVCGVFIHPAATDDSKIYQYNYDATKLAIERAMKNEPK